MIKKGRRVLSELDGYHYTEKRPPRGRLAGTGSEREAEKRARPSLPGVSEGNGDVDYDAFDHNIEKWNGTAPHASGPRMPRSVMKSMRL